ncbi:S8 family serine peptidase [Streptomyces shenzhenensis]|uniref:S8 family serine peptidase n=1 Tax=Streptomyces shenzhenensis TaxID=943815 RepID=UPI00382F5C66
MRDPRRLRAAAVFTAAAVAVAGMVVAGPAAAGPGPAGQSAEPGSTPQESAKPTQVTLITGDVLTVRSIDGRTAISANGSGPSQGIVSLHEENDHTYAVPAAAQAGVNSGHVDRELFNIDTLTSNGYGTSGPVPLIIDNQDGAEAPAKPSQAQGGRALKSINALAVTVAKSRTESFWHTYDSADDLRACGIDRIWLDGKVSVDLAESVPQIGAPDAWKAGFDGKGATVAVLDTGVDATHPDLEGRISQTKNFTTSADAVDHHGHGTHVAATVGGSGAGNGHKGGAPGTDLMVGKVLDDDGTGTFSSIIAGMEWASRNGADVVSMSLGSDAPDDGSGPLSASIDELTEETGSLFVVAAGNAGRRTIGSPASASEALTVGAVDKADALAGFSTRGPRSGDFAVKPEISAPGVNILAARAAGTGMGTPADDLYTTASGTSMATPHVAGAAAILKQQHPTWSAHDLKAALVTTAEAGEYQVAEGGVGRVDLTRAVSQQAYGTPAALNLGAIRYAEAGDYKPVERAITLHNSSGSDRTFTIKDDGVNAAGQRLPEDAVTVSRTSVTVPAGASADVTISVDPNLLARDTHYTGRVSATAEDGTAVLFPFSFLMEKKMFDVTVKGTGADGVAAGGPSQAHLFSATGLLSKTSSTFNAQGVARLRVEPGEYMMYTNIFTPDASRSWIEAATAAFDSSVTVDRDVTITLDAREATEVAVDTGRTTEWRGGAFTYVPRGVDFMTLLSADIKTISTLPSPGDKSSEFVLNSSLTAPVLTAKAKTRKPLTLTPTQLEGAERFSGHRTLKAVDAGTGTPAEYRKINARNKIVLVTRDADVPISEQIDTAARHGAAAVAVANDTPGRLVAPAGSTAAPAFALYGEQGKQLAAQAAKGTVRIELRGTPFSPFQYDLVHSVQSIPQSGLKFVTDSTNTARIDAHYYAHAQQEGNLLQASGRTGQYFYASTTVPIRLGATHEEYVTAGPATRYWTGADIAGSNGIAVFDQGWHSFTAGERRGVDWFKQVANPTRGATWMDQGYSPAVGDYLSIGAMPFPDSEPSHQPTPGWNDKMSVVLYRGDKEIGRTDDYFYKTFYVDLEPGTYRAVQKIDRDAPGWEFSSSATTEWTIKIAKTGVSSRIPMPTLAYDIDVNLRNRVKAGKQQPITVRATLPPNTEGTITEVKTWASYDDGASWTPVKLNASQVTGEFTGTLRLPRASATSGHVTLRTQATDASGNRIDQTVERAFGLE